MIYVGVLERLLTRPIASLSPDGQTLLSVGDSPKVYLHHLSSSSRLTFTPITTLTLPPPDGTLYYTSSLAASFSTAFSSNGTKFAVASQEGSVVVWDVRSSQPLKIFQTDKTRMPAGRSMNGGASGWLSDDPWDWSRGGYQAPGWGVRSVKFGSSDSGREVMTFTEVWQLPSSNGTLLTGIIAHNTSACHRCADIRDGRNCPYAELHRTRTPASPTVAYSISTSRIEIAIVFSNPKIEVLFSNSFLILTCFRYSSSATSAAADSPDSFVQRQRRSHQVAS